MHLSELKAMHVSALLEMAIGLDIDNAARLRKQELMFAILKKRAKSGEQIFGDGALEVLPDGFGFLRSPDASYMASTDDIYISPSQIRRFNLHTGDSIEGEVRTPKTASAISRWSRSTRSTANRRKRPSTASCSRT
jgi:transcription termination factor Rho